jgi:hypothetical protein
MGDNCEFVNPTDKRFDSEILADWIPSYKLSKISEVQADWIIKTLKPISPQCIGMLAGNHEETIRLKYHHHIHGHICGALGVKAFGYSALINLFFRAKTHQAGSYLIKMAVRHGTGGGYYVGGKINRAILQTGEIDADIYASGHTHIKTGTIEVLLGSTDSENPTSIEKPKAIIITGTFRQTYFQGTSDYAEKKAYRPTALGSPYLDIWAEKRERQKQAFWETKMRLIL